MTMIKRTVLVVGASLLLVACGDQSSGNTAVEGAGSVARESGASVTFQGFTQEMDWSNCRDNGNRWQADGRDSLMYLDISRNLDAGTNQYRYVIGLDLRDEIGGSSTGRWHNLYGWEYRPEVEVSEAGIRGTGVVYPRDIASDQREETLVQVDFDIRC